MSAPAKRKARVFFANSHAAHERREISRKEAAARLRYVRNNGGRWRVGASPSRMTYACTLPSYGAFFIEKA